MPPSDVFPGPGRFVWQRVWDYPDVLIQPLDAETVDRSHHARVWVGGAIAALLRHSAGRWELSPPDQPEHVESGGSAAIAVVSNWLLSSEENQA